jgi:hypothetical protein
MPGPLAEALLTFLKDQSFWERASARSITWVRERFDIAKQTMKLERLYDECREQYDRNLAAQPGSVATSRQLMFPSSAASRRDSLVP